MIKCIEAFKEEQEGKIGYFENEIYYNNTDVISLFNSLRDRDDYYKDCWNHYLIQVEHERYWDRRGYDEENSVITNKYKGLEIYTKTELTFNEASQWTIGKYANKSIITFEYDKRKDEHNCKLLIENYVYDSNKGLEIHSYNEECNRYKNDLTKLIQRVELSGSFTELYEKLANYICMMCAIHEIKL